MRKELVCFIRTTERGIDASIRAMRGDSGILLLEHEGHKFAVPCDELQSAINSLNEFYGQNQLNSIELPADGRLELRMGGTPIEAIPCSQEGDVEYVED